MLARSFVKIMHLVSTLERNTPAQHVDLESLLALSRK
jgi:hypothetical protein